MSLASYYQEPEFGISFELFPPKSEKGELSLYQHVERLMQFSPRYFTCTYGAGGSTRDKTLDIVSTIRQRFGIPVASHLTLVGSTQDQLREYLLQAQQSGVDYIVALRGDPPKGEQSFVPVEGGLNFANELVALIRAEFPQFGIAVAGYPEKHQEAASMEIDLQNLKRKVDAGGDIVITQLFYQNEDFFRFREACDRLGIRVAIVPGILPITNFEQIQRITSLCGAKLPTDLVQSLNQAATPEDQYRLGIEFAVAQVQELIDQQVTGLHFYVLNKSEATSEVLEKVKLPEFARRNGSDA
jgi:methylenetetrahydrofolate reductase (NADPH)